MTRAKRDTIIKEHIKQLEIKRASIDKIIKDVTNHLAGQGIARRIRPCDINDPDEKECPWPTKLT